jgi:hypothetical protein
MGIELSQWLNSINQSKINLIDDDKTLENEYPPYIINRCLSGHIDCLMYSNEMNKFNLLPKKLQYDFYINIIRNKKRFSPWFKKDKVEELESVKRYYGYSNEKAKQALRLLSKEQLNFIKTKLDTGGLK